MNSSQKKKFCLGGRHYFNTNVYKSIKSKLKKLFRRTQISWKKILKPAIKAKAPFMGMAVSAKYKNPKVGQATPNIVKKISRGKILSLTDLHSNGLRLKIV